MAQKVTILLEDDIDGSTEDISTIRFGLDGTNYEIDLSPSNETKLRDALADFVKNGRKVAGGRGAGRSTSKASNSGTPAAEIREWAKSNGHSVPDRGRIPAEVREAFEKANG